MPDFDARSAVAVRRVADRLGSLITEVVFVGGAVVPLLATDSAGVDFRETEDVDLVTEVVTYRERVAFEAALRQRGFRDAADGGHAARWRVDDLVVDAVPQRDAGLGFENCWYPIVLETDGPLAIPSGPTVRVVSAPAFVATKWEAFLDRGRGADFAGSHDLEDILTVLDTRAETADEVARAPTELRRAVTEAAVRLLGAEPFLDVLPGLVEPGRDGIVLDRLRRIAALAV